jgi:hypothetical protein
MYHVMHVPCVTASSYHASTKGGGRPWLSPETLENPHRASKSSDVYMLGGIMHEVLTGKYGVMGGGWGDELAVCE